MPKAEVDFQVGEQCFYSEEYYIYRCRVVDRKLEPAGDDQHLTLTLKVVEHIQESAIFNTTPVDGQFTVDKMVEASKGVPARMGWQITDAIATEIR